MYLNYLGFGQFLPHPMRKCFGHVFREHCRREILKVDPNVVNCQIGGSQELDEFSLAIAAAPLHREIMLPAFQSGDEQVAAEPIVNRPKLFAVEGDGRG